MLAKKCGILTFSWVKCQKNLSLAPVERQSGASALGPAAFIQAGPARIRTILYMVALVGTQHILHIKVLYQRLQERGKTKMSSLGAAMRMPVHLCFGVLKTRQPYQPDYTVFVRLSRWYLVSGKVLTHHLAGPKRCWAVSVKISLSGTYHDLIAVSV
jgi:hypothetical protein